MLFGFKEILPNSLNNLGLLMPYNGEAILPALIHLIPLVSFFNILRKPLGIIHLVRTPIFPEN